MRQQYPPAPPATPRLRRPSTPTSHADRCWCAPSQCLRPCHRAIPLHSQDGRGLLRNQLRPRTVSVLLAPRPPALPRRRRRLPLPGWRVVIEERRAPNLSRRLPVRLLRGHGGRLRPLPLHRLRLQPPDRVVPHAQLSHQRRAAPGVCGVFEGGTRPPSMRARHRPHLSQTVRLLPPETTPIDTQRPQTPQARRLTPPAPNTSPACAG
jgi:hypothetical protein